MEMSPSLRPLVNKLVDNGPKLTRAFLRNIVTAKDVRDGALENARILASPDGENLRAFLNTATVDSNITIDADLQRTTILQDMVVAFRRKLVPVDVFGRTFQNVP
ncbi:MAG: hypothetical protein U1F98_05690, partial [Verrucomicrobiota bacterium]